MLSKEVSSTIFKVFGMTRPETEPKSPPDLWRTLYPNGIIITIDIIDDVITITIMILMRLN